MCSNTTSKFNFKNINPESSQVIFLPEGFAFWVIFKVFLARDWKKKQVPNLFFLLLEVFLAELPGLEELSSWPMGLLGWERAEKAGAP